MKRKKTTNKHPNKLPRAAALREQLASAYWKAASDAEAAIAKLERLAASTAKRITRPLAALRQRVQKVESAVADPVGDYERAMYEAREQYRLASIAAQRDYASALSRIDFTV